jgi:toxin ParE1/3/4
LLESARAFGVDAAERYDLLMRSVFAALAAVPDRPGSQEVTTAKGVRVYPLRIGRRLVAEEQRVGRPRHIVVYRVGSDGVVEIIGLAHDACCFPLRYAECVVLRKPREELMRPPSSD